MTRGGARWLPWLLFAVLAPLAVGVRSEPVGQLLTGSVPEGMALFAHHGSTMALRMGGPLLFAAVEAVLQAAAGLMMVEPGADPSFLGSPWGTDAHLRSYIRDAYVPLVAFFLVRLALLAAIPVAALTLFRTTAARCVAVTLMTLTVGGWNTDLVSLVFRAGSLVADWPHAYYLFAHRLIYSDLPALAVVLLLTARLARGVPGFGVAAAMAAGAQLFYEHLGFVTGVAIFLVALPALGWRAAALRLASAGAGSAAVLAALITAVGAPAGEGNGLGSYLSSMWTLYGANNVAWWRVVAANFLSLLALPTLGGVLLGLAAGLMSGERTTDVTAQHRAGQAVFAAFLAAMVPGIFVSGLAVDLGRQALPLAVLAVLAAAKTAQSISFGKSPYGR